MTNSFPYFLLAILLVHFSPQAMGAAQVGVSGNPGARVQMEMPIAETKPKSTKFKANVSSYFYNFEGTQAQRNGLYEFANTTLRMELLTLQYQASPKWTVMLIGQRLENYVETRIPGLGYFEDTTKGFGDTLLSGTYLLSASSSLLLMADLGLSMPTGSISKKNRYFSNLNYPYNMQMGSGTYDPVVGVMPIWLGSSYQVGGRLSSTVRTGENQNGYRLGNLYRLDAWADYNLGRGFTPRLVGYYKHKEAIHGQDRTLGRSPYTEFYHHDQMNWDVSAALKYKYDISGPALAVAAEIGVPLFQNSDNFDNIVVSTQYFGSLSLNGTF